MQQHDSDFFPLSYTIPNTVRQFADRDIYVKKDNLGENFGKLRNILRDNFPNMQASRIELKKGFDEKKCNNVDDINVEKNVYFVIFPTGERISFSPSGITASNGAAITSKNARNLYGSEEFESCFADAVLTNNPTALFNLLQRYSKKNNTVNKQHLRENLYRKDIATNEYQPVEQNYNMDNFFQSAVDNYNNNKQAKPYMVHNSKKSYPEYKYDSYYGCVREPFTYKVPNGPELFIEEYYDMNSGCLDSKINYNRPIYYIQNGRYLIPVYQTQYYPY
ncbi:MAG: hypothetical protein IJ590_00525 [Rickettsiales bacterium]|nr:hypothetical protein [Rickettsiales bacterium]